MKCALFPSENENNLTLKNFAKESSFTVRWRKDNNINAKIVFDGKIKANKISKQTRSEVWNHLELKNKII